MNDVASLKQKSSSRLKMQIKNLQDTIEYLRHHMLHANDGPVPGNINQSEEVNPVLVRKTPKFPSRERHLAIRRRKPLSSPESQRSESLCLSLDSEHSSENE